MVARRIIVARDKIAVRGAAQRAILQRAQLHMGALQGTLHDGQLLNRFPTPRCANLLRLLADSTGRFISIAAHGVQGHQDKNPEQSQQADAKRQHDDCIHGDLPSLTELSSCANQGP